MEQQEWRDVAADLERQIEALADSEPVFHPTLIAGLVGRVRIVIALIREHFQGT